MAWLSRIWNTLRSHSLQKELDEELQHHIDLRTADLERGGMSHTEAYAAATRQFGNTTLQTERMRRMDVATWMETVFSDLRYALRQFRRSPLFTALAVLSLALGIGANTAIFSVMDAILLRTLPVHDPQQLVSLTDPDQAGLWMGTADGERVIISYQEFLQLRDRLTSLSGLCAMQSWLGKRQVRVAGAQQEQVSGRLVSEEYFSVLRVDPAIGRVFTSADAKAPGQDPYAVISYDFWQRRFGGRTDVLGTTIKLNNALLTVVGVAEKDFKGESGGEDPDLWIPLLMQPMVNPGRDWLHEDSSVSTNKTIWLHALGRIKPGKTLAGLQAEVNVTFKGMLEAFYPPTMTEEAKKEAFGQYLVVHEARLGSFSGRDDYAQQLKILLAVAGLVLLIACANVANLLLARATARRREVGIRFSIGASRSRLFRQFFTESLVLSVLGGLAGLALAWLGARLLVGLLGGRQNLLVLSTDLDWRVLTFTLTVTLLTGILFGVAPSLRASRTDVNQSMRLGASGTHSGRRLTLAKVLVVGQVAISLLLVIGAGLFLRTLWNLQSTDLGYPRENLLQVGVDGATAGYKDQQLVLFYQDVANRLRALPGVRGASYSELGLMTGGESNTNVKAEGFIAQKDEDKQSRFDIVAPGYFNAVGVPLVLGRDLGPQDTTASTHVCVVNEELAKRFFAGQSPIGRHLTSEHGKDGTVTLEIVGVVKNLRSRSLRGNIPQRFYVPAAQGWRGRIPSAMIFEIRTTADPKSIATEVRKAISSVNPDAPVTFSISMEEVITDRTAFTNLIARLCGIFGGLALLLAGTGLYGLLSYGVTRRTNEIGIRMALGAGRRSVLAMILQESSVLLLLGLIVGLGVAVATTRLIASELYGLSQFDPVSFVAASVLLAAVAMVAGYIPAARAARVDPVRALRHE